MRVSMRERKSMCDWIYHQGFHLELSHAFVRSNAELQGLYLAPFGEEFDLGHRDADNSMILAMKTNHQHRLYDTST